MINGPGEIVVTVSKQSSQSWHRNFWKCLRQDDIIAPPGSMLFRQLLLMIIVVVAVAAADDV